MARRPALANVREYTPRAPQPRDQLFSRGAEIRSDAARPGGRLTEPAGSRAEASRGGARDARRRRQLRPPPSRLGREWTGRKTYAGRPAVFTVYARRAGPELFVYARGTL